MSMQSSRPGSRRCLAEAGAGRERVGVLADEPDPHSGHALGSSTSPHCRRFRSPPHTPGRRRNPGRHSPPGRPRRRHVGAGRLRRGSVGRAARGEGEGRRGILVAVDDHVVGGARGRGEVHRLGGVVRFARGTRAGIGVADAAAIGGDDEVEVGRQVREVDRDGARAGRDRVHGLRPGGAPADAVVVVDVAGSARRVAGQRGAATQYALSGADPPEQLGSPAQSELNSRCRRLRHCPRRRCSWSRWRGRRRGRPR